MLQLLRVLQVLANLSPSKFMKASDLASELEVSARTIIRDVQSLKDAGAPSFQPQRAISLKRLAGFPISRCLARKNS